MLAATVLALVPGAASSASAGVPGLPGAIEGTWGTGDNASTLTVTWTSPGGSYLEYDVRYRVDSGTVFDPSPEYPSSGWSTPTGSSLPTTSTSFAIPSLTSTSTYVVAVRARDRSTGRYGDDWAISGLIEPTGTPDRPSDRSSDIVETSRTATSLALQWPRASGAAGGYEVRVSENTSTRSWATVLSNVTQPSSGSTVTTTLTTTNLPSTFGIAKTYVAQVRSKSAAGTCGSGSVKCSRWVTSPPLAQLDISGLTAAAMERGSDPSYVRTPALDFDAQWDASPVAGVSYEVAFYYRDGNPDPAHNTVYDDGDNNAVAGSKPDSWRMDWDWYNLCWVHNDSVPTGPLSTRGCADHTDPSRDYYWVPHWWFGKAHWGAWVPLTAAAAGCASGTGKCSHTFADVTRAGGRGKVMTSKVRVRAVSAGTKGPVAEYTSRSPLAPYPPYDLVATAPTGASFKVCWSRPFHRGSAIEGYDIELYDTSAPSTATETVTGTWGTQVPGKIHRFCYTFHDDITTAKTYYAKVRASNGVGDSDWAQSPNQSLAATAPPAPAPPSASGTGTSVTLTWEAPPDNGGSAVTGYGIQYRAQNTDSTWPSSWTSYTHTGTGTTATVGSLTSGTAYQFQVSAVNSVGTGPWSAAVMRGAAPAAPAAPTLTSGNASLAVSWTAPTGPDGGSAVSDYDLQYRSSTDGGTNWGTWTAFAHAGTARTATITGLTNGNLHQVQVRASNASGAGAWSTAAQETPFGPLGAPTGVTASASKGGVSVAWTAPADNGGSAVTGAQVRTRVKNPQGDWTAAVDSVDDPATSPARIIGLTVGTEVDVQLRVVNARGHSIWVDAGSATPLATTKPTGKAQDVSVTYANSKFWVRFNHTGDDGGLPLQVQMSGTVHTQNSNRNNSGLNYTVGTAAQRSHNGTDYDFVYWFDQYQNSCCDNNAWVSICRHTGTQVSKVSVLVKNTVGDSGWHNENLNPRVDSGCAG